MRTRALYLALLVCISLHAQEKKYMTGLLPDDGTYETLPRKAELLTRDYTVLPSKHLLIQYCPDVKYQDAYGTCTSWATVYAARTIAEAVKNAWTDKNIINEEAFAPMFVYALTKDRKKYPNDNDCQRGTHIFNALQLMKDKGVVKLNRFNVLCANYVSQDLMDLAGEYKIDEYFTLFGKTISDVDLKVRRVKKSLSEDCPVIIAMWLPDSFFETGDIWNGIDNNPKSHGYHAMCVIGYDDSVNGGSFRIMNSWGTNWGNKGYVWVKYSDFAKYVDQAYEIYVKKSLQPKPVPQPIPVIVNDLSGEISLQLSTGEKMVPIFNTERKVYRIADDFISGTRYRIYITNNEPAYVYVIGSDLNNSVSKVFPPSDTISPALTYKSNHIAIPDETYYVEMDNTIGTDYMCILYSKKALDINSIINSVKSTNGSFSEKVRYALTDALAETDDVRYILNNIGFSAKTDKSVVPVIIEISHK